MPRYIDAEGLNLYDDLFMSEDTINKSGVYVRYRAVENLIKNAPTADVAEVNHGKWICEKHIILDTTSVYIKWKCSNCGFIAKKGLSYDDINNYAPSYLYCPECGAKMDLEEND